MGGVEPADVAQGEIGDCWLLAAVATLADHQGAVESCFVSKQYSPRGLYTIKLFDPAEDAFVSIDVDDYIPCHQESGMPIMAQPHGNEIWVLLLEKAFAKCKYYGTYKALEGGLPCYALHLLTGGDCLHWSAKAGEGDTWSAFGVGAEITRGNEQEQKITLKGSDEKDKTTDELFVEMCKWVASGHILSAGSDGKDNTQTEGRDNVKQTIVPGHAYSILRCEQIEEFKLIRLRNPWGTFAWD